MHPLQIQDEQPSTASDASVPTSAIGLSVDVAAPKATPANPAATQAPATKATPANPGATQAPATKATPAVGFEGTSEEKGDEKVGMG